MTKKTYIILFILIATLCIAMQVQAQEDVDSAQASSYSAPAPVSSTPFTLLILGTRSAQDIDVIRKNVQRISGVSRLVPYMESQQHIEFRGMHGGSTEGLISDIKGLASDRYEMTSKNDERHGLVITLRKIQGKAN